MTQIRVVVVEDEPLARAGMCALLEADPDFVVTGEAETADEAVAAIRSQKPELVMLDVQLSGSDGFEVIRAIGADEMPAVVFVTAFDEYAVAAFEVNAVDYLLKPFDDERFSAMLARAKQVVRQADVAVLSRKLAELLSTSGLARPEVAAGQRYVDRLVVKTSGRTFFLRVSDIDWIEAADYYVKIHTGKDAHLLRESMNALETRLDPARFFRVHRSAIVNLDRVRELQPYFRGEHVVILQDGTRLKLSRVRREKLEAALHQGL